MRGTCARVLAVALLAGASAAALAFPAFMENGPDAPSTALAPPSALTRIVHVHPRVPAERTTTRRARKASSIAHRPVALATVVGHRTPVARHGRAVVPVAAPKPVRAPAAPAPATTPAAPTPTPTSPPAPTPVQPAPAAVVEPERVLAVAPVATPPAAPPAEPAPAPAAPPAQPADDGGNGAKGRGNANGHGDDKDNGNGRGAHDKGDDNGHGN
jgi:hypothetical protein